MKVVSANTVDEALAALQAATTESRVLAGGTDLMVEMESGRTQPDLVVDVWKLDALRGIHATEAGVEVGALATCTDLLRSDDVRKHADILVEAARLVGAVQIQNRATIGGNLGTASPAADLNPVLFALSARVRLVSKRGEREMPVEAFVSGYRKTERALDELIASVVIPYRSPDERRAFRKVGTRKAQSIAKVVVALCVELDGQRIRSIRCAAGSVADRTLLVGGTEWITREFNGRGTIQALREGVDPRWRPAITPRDDVRSSADYRRGVFLRIVERMLVDLVHASRSEA
jgi:xanthine dehydrogenase FAD-binding subunit